MARKKKPNIKDLKAPDVPLLEESSGGNRRIGKTYKLTLGRFITNLLEMNETRPRTSKWHDGQIAAAIVKEYSEHPDTTEKYDVSRTDSREVRKAVAQIRGEYNNGKLILHSGPASGLKYSFQYNEKGEAVNARTKNYRPLSTGEIKARRKAADMRVQAWLKKNPEQLKRKM